MVWQTGDAGLTPRGWARNIASALDAMPSVKGIELNGGSKEPNLRRATWAFPTFGTPPRFDSSTDEFVDEKN
jgi:hypothetical protein